MPNYLAIENPNIDKLIQGFKLLEISFAGFDYESINKELFEAVYENHLFEINYDNIRLMLQVFFEVKNEDSIRHKNYISHFLISEFGAYGIYSEENICPEYLDIILEQSNGKICDSEACYIVNFGQSSSHVSTIRRRCLENIEALRTETDSIDSVKDCTIVESTFI